MYKIVHRFNYVDKLRESRSLESVTIPNQAPDLKYIIGQINNGNPVSVVDMRADNDANLDDIDMRFVDTKHLTSESIDAMLNDLDLQAQARKALEGSENQFLSQKLHFRESNSEPKEPPTPQDA